MDKQFIRDFMHNHQYCVVSTVDSQGKPESALVAFSENDVLELIFGTAANSRKYKNLLQNPAISVVNGNAREISNTKDYDIGADNILSW